MLLTKIPGVANWPGNSGIPWLLLGLLVEESLWTVEVVVVDSDDSDDNDLWEEEEIDEVLDASRMIVLFDKSSTDEPKEVPSITADTS